MDRIGSPFDLDAYVPVAQRIQQFYACHPTGRIVTELISRTERDVVFKALVYRSAREELPAATGWAAEREADSDINLVACLENTETSAVGRALANLGFTASLRRPSAEEMIKASRARIRFSRHAESRNDLEETKSAERLSQSSARGLPDREKAPLSQRHADATLDALRLLRAASRAGLNSLRQESLEAKLRSGVSMSSIERLETVLRKLLAAAPWNGVKGDTL